MTYSQTIIQSISINYKSWLSIFVSLYLISMYRQNFIIASITFFVMMTFSYLFHYLLHFKYTYPHNITHLYHHKFTHSFSNMLQLMLEFISILAVIFIKKSFTVFLSFVDEWAVLYFYFFYTTMHNINYGYFHVNKVHEIHHKELSSNLGPDICDILFGTKQESVENTDHYIWNIVFSSLLILLLQQFWKKSMVFERHTYIVFSQFLFLSCSLFLAFTTVYLYKEDVQNSFAQDIQKIKEKWNPQPIDC